MLTEKALITKYPNGQVEWRIPIEWIALGVYRFHGSAQQFYVDGALKLVRQYEHGVEEGDEVMYYRDGKVMSVLPFRNGLKEGTYCFYHPDGNTEEVVYEGGERKETHDKPDPGREPGAKKILPGDYVPASASRRSA